MNIAQLELVAKTLEYETVDVACGNNHVVSVTGYNSIITVYQQFYIFNLLIIADNNLFVWGRGESGKYTYIHVDSICQ